MPAVHEGLVSVLVPTFNGERFLEETLRSIVDQTHERLEILLCDDGSTDATVAIARRFAAEDPRVRLHLDGPHLGPVANFVRCLELARGPYVKFLMQDDLLVPHAIERLLEALLGHEDIVLATSRRLRIDQGGEVLPDRPEVVPPFQSDAVVDGRVLGDLVLERNLNLIGEPSTVLFRRDALSAARPFSVGGTHYRYIADVALWLALLQHGRAAYLIDPLCRFRAHPDQDSATRSNMVVSVLEWHQLRAEASEIGYLATPEARRRARERWLSIAPFFFRFSTGPRQAWALARSIVAANDEAVRDGSRSPLRAVASSARALGSAPVAGLLATPYHHVRRRLPRAGRSV